MQIAALICDRLDPAVRAKVDALVKLNPDYSKWIDRVADADRDCFAFVHASTWADDPDKPQRRAKHRLYRSSAPQILALSRPSFSSDGTAVRPPDPVNALTQIKALATGSLRMRPTT